MSRDLLDGLTVNLVPEILLLLAELWGQEGQGGGGGVGSEVRQILLMAMVGAGGQVGVTAHRPLSGLVSLASTASAPLAICQVTDFTRFQAELGPVLLLRALRPVISADSPHLRDL